MKYFILNNISNQNKIKRLEQNKSLTLSYLLPKYNERYICYRLNIEFSFEKLMSLFINGNDDEVIGSMSYIAEVYSYELYNYLLINLDSINTRKIIFIYENVIQNYLPVFVPLDKLNTYYFDNSFQDDIWVKILLLIRENNY